MNSCCHATVVCLLAAAALLFFPPVEAGDISRQEKTYLARIQSDYRSSSGEIIVEKREAIVAWERARLFIHTHTEAKMVWETGDQVSGSVFPYTYNARQRLHKDRVGIEVSCRSDRLGRTDEAKRNQLVFWNWVKTGTLPYPHLIHPYGVALEEFTFPVPGTTRAEIALQLDTLLHLLAWEQAVLGGCREVEVVDTGYLRAPEPIRFDQEGRMVVGRWDELWTVEGCGNTTSFLLIFRADGEGGTLIESRREKTDPQSP
jgi:hypothetical protein